MNKERSGQMILEKRSRSPLFPYFYRKITYKMNKNTETTAIGGIFGRAAGLVHRTSRLAQVTFIQLHVDVELNGCRTFLERRVLCHS
ncbi:hypothetical protein OB236_28030 [Paenibacillus sp. WQ 127069]|uniref:Uncharacterized protein n=1 Tax=Paenibacillus baimaensis TaxID=2982185 RepID=A0ABT2UMU4_9BACL|nr:hypothetical protein [Paenibacillus sp. WQ 127069]